MNTAILDAPGSACTMASASASAELARLYLSEMPSRLRAMSDASEAGQFDELARLAHHLKSAAGSSGFDQLTPYAARLERAAGDRRHTLAINVALDDLIAACGRAQASGAA